MNDGFWLALWQKILDLMPALGGSFISLRYLDKEDSDFVGRVIAFISSFILGYWGGHLFIEYKGIGEDSWTAKAIIITVGIIGLPIMNKLVQAVKSISAKDMKAWIIKLLGN